MARYRIVCIEKHPTHKDRYHHIVAVGTGSDPDQADQRWTVDEVIAALDAGHTFYVKDSQGNSAEVIAANCPVHGHNHRIIITVADDKESDNLLDLRECRPFRT